MNDALLAQVYSRASGEMSLRLSLRNNIRITYLSVSWVVLGLIFGFIVKIGESTIDTTEEKILAVIMITMTPLLGLLLMLWSRYNDYIIGLLSDYCNKVVGDNISFTHWHNPKHGWLGLARTKRVYFDYPMYGVLLLNAGISSLLAIHLFKGSFQFIGCSITFVGILTIFTFSIIYKSNQDRKNLRIKLKMDDNDPLKVNLR